AKWRNLSPFWHSHNHCLFVIYSAHRRKNRSNDRAPLRADPSGEFMMKLKAILALSCCVLAGAFLVSHVAIAQAEGGGGGGRRGGFPQPAPEKQVTITAIPGVISADAQWKLVWQGPDNADGLVGMKDGSVLFAQEQPSTVRRI